MNTKGIEIDKLLILYNLAELSYQKNMQAKGFEIDKIYPLNWHKNIDYQLKIEIIAEAIKNNQLIVETERYQNMKECIKEDKIIKKEKNN